MPRPRLAELDGRRRPRTRSGIRPRDDRPPGGGRPGHPGRAPGPGLSPGRGDGGESGRNGPRPGDVPPTGRADGRSVGGRRWRVARGGARMAAPGRVGARRTWTRQRTEPIRSYPRWCRWMRARPPRRPAGPPGRPGAPRGRGGRCPVSPPGRGGQPPGPGRPHPPRGGRALLVGAVACVALLAVAVAGIVITGRLGAGRGPAGLVVASPSARLADAQFARPSGAPAPEVPPTLTGVAAAGRTVVAVGSQAALPFARPLVLTSPDGGRTWQPAVLRAPAGGGMPLMVAGGHGGWLAVGPDAAWTSPDGRSWRLGPGVAPLAGWRPRAGAGADARRVRRRGRERAPGGRRSRAHAGALDVRQRPHLAAPERGRARPSGRKGTGGRPALGGRARQRPDDRGGGRPHGGQAPRQAEGESPHPVPRACGGARTTASAGGGRTRPSATGRPPGSPGWRRPAPGSLPSGPAGAPRGPGTRWLTSGAASPPGVSPAC